MTMTNKLTHHPLSAEAVTDDDGLSILLEQQDGIEDRQSIILHPWQLRAVCEQFGVIASDKQAAKTIATLQRRLQMLNERIDHLAYWLTNCTESERVDLTYERVYATATADLAAEWCAEQGTEPKTATAPQQRSSIAESAQPVDTDPRQLSIDMVGAK